MAATSDIAVPKDGHFVDKTGVEGVIDIINETSAALQPESTFNIIEQLDPNFLLEASKIDLHQDGLDPFDHIAMRKWINEQYIPLPKAPINERIRPQALVTSKDISISYGKDNTFSVRVYTPTYQNTRKETLRPALMMIHGGGFIHGSPEVDDDISKFITSEVNAIVISVDYRLAPEHPFPAAHNDCYEALGWIVDNAAQYQIDPKRIGIWGASAGANLAASIALRDSADNRASRIRIAGLAVPPVCHPSLYPSILKSKSASPQRFTAGGAADTAADVLAQMWAIYAGDKFADPYASVLLAPVSKTHPPVHITVCGCDALRDEGIAYAMKLRDAGVDAQLEIVPGVPHGLNVSPKTHVAKQWYRNLVRVLNCALNTDF